MLPLLDKKKTCGAQTATAGVGLGYKKDTH